MKLHQRTLKNGLRIQSIEMPGTRVVTSLILVGAGSRYEEKKISGISHFLEHMFFKGGARYKKPKEVAEAIDGVGGEFNAFTGKEVVGYYVKAAKPHKELALDVLSDMLLNATFPPEEIEKERGVILEEAAMYLDLPTYQVSWDFEKVLYGDQPLGRDQIGTKKLIKSVTQKDFKDYQHALYTPENTVITLSGAVNEKDLDTIEKFFTFDKKRTKSKESAPLKSPMGKRFHLRNKETEQYHLNFGVLAPSEESADFPTARVLATILGGNMSSRMFMYIREKLGLCYSIKTSAEGFSDTGFISTRSGVKLNKSFKAIKAIRKEYDMIAKEGITEKELKKAQSFICGKIDLSTEDTEEVAYHYGKNAVLYEMVEDFDDWKNKITSVTKSHVDTLAKELLQPKNFKFAGIGPALSEKKLIALIS